MMLSYGVMIGTVLIWLKWFGVERGNWMGMMRIVVLFTLFQGAMVLNNLLDIKVIPIDATGELLASSEWALMRLGDYHVFYNEMKVFVEQYK